MKNRRHRPSGSGTRRSAIDHRPRKRLGQHFLAEPWARRVAAAVAAQPGDVFLEIGPGTGALTLPLAETGRPILAVDIDRTLVAGLAKRVPPNVTVMAGDVLSTDLMAYLTGLEPQRPPEPAPSDLPNVPRRYRVVGNLPYNIASPILFRLLAWHETHGMPADATVMVQREVADRLAAKPGTKAYGVLTILVRLHADVHRLFDLPPGAFYPQPKVRSSVLRLTFRPPAVRLRDVALFERMVKAMFGQRRKTLSNALKAFNPQVADVLAHAGIDGRRRPETLQMAELGRLADLFQAREVAS